jgi:hypothetical protein
MHRPIIPHQPITILRTIPKRRYARPPLRPLQPPLTLPLATNPRPVIHPLHIHRLSRQIRHHRLVVLVLALKGTRDRVAHHPQHRRERGVVRAAEAAGLVEQAFDAVGAHRGDEALDEGEVDLGGLLRGAVAEHEDHEVGAANEGGEVQGGVGDGALGHFEVGGGWGGEFGGCADEAAYGVAVLEGELEEVAAGAAGGAEEEEGGRFGHVGVLLDVAGST